MKSPAPGHSGTAGFWGIGWQTVAPTLAAVIIVAMTVWWGMHASMMRQARQRDLVRVERYAKLSKLLLESGMPAKPVASILAEIKALGLDRIEFLPPDTPREGPNPRFIPQLSTVEGWQHVNGADGKPAGIVLVSRGAESSRIMLEATRRFAAVFVIGSLVLCGAFLWATRAMVARRIKRLTTFLQTFDPCANADGVAGSADPIENLSLTIAKCADSVRREREARQILLDGHGGRLRASARPRARFWRSMQPTAAFSAKRARNL